MSCLNRFKGWCQENFPFIEDDFNAITDYQLMCKLKEYVVSIGNDVANLEIDYNELAGKIVELEEIVNNMDGEFDDLIEEFNSLKTLVESYNMRIQANANRIEQVNTNLQQLISLNIDEVKDLINNLKDYVDREDTLILADISSINDNIILIRKDIEVLAQGIPKVRDTGTVITLNDTIKDAHIDIKLDPSELSQETNILPDGYTQVEYIESTGTQSINTNYQMASQKEKIEIKFEYTSISTQTCTFGSKDSNNLQSITPFGRDNVGIYIGASSNLTPKNVVINTIYDLSVEADNGNLTTIWNGEKQTSTYNGNIGTQKIALFAQINSANTFANNSNIRCYSFKIYDNDILKRNLVPCYRNNDNKIGMYDLVNNQFYANGGSGTFVKGSTLPTPTTPIPINVISGDNEIVVSNSDNTLSQIKPLTLGNIEYCKIGNYQDNFFKTIDGDSIYDALDSTTKESLTSGKWYIQKNIGKEVYNGSESWDMNTSFTNTFTRSKPNNALSNNSTILSNYFCTVSSLATDTDGMRIGTNINFKIRSISSTENFKTWLSTHNTILYYANTTPQYILLNDTLQQQLDDIYETLKAYNDQTNITQINHDLPFIITAITMKKGSVTDEV